MSIEERLGVSEAASPTTPPLWAEETGRVWPSVGLIDLRGLHRPGAEEMQLVVVSAVGDHDATSTAFRAGTEPPALFADAFPELASAGVGPHLDAVLASGEARCVLLHDGSRTWSVDVSAVPGGLTMVWADRTELMSLRRSAQIDPEWVRPLLDRWRQLVLVVRPDGIISYASAAAAALLREDPDDLKGRTLEDLLHPDDVAAARRARDADDGCMVRMRRGDDRWRWLAADWSTLEQANGQVLHGAAVHDVDHLVEAVPDVDEVAALVRTMADAPDAPIAAVAVLGIIRDEAGAVVDLACESATAVRPVDIRLPSAGERLSVAFPHVWRSGLFDDLATVSRGRRPLRFPHARLTGRSAPTAYEVSIITLGRRVIMSWRNRGERPVPSRSEDGAVTLSPRERDILSLLAEGASTVAIAHTLHLSTNTVRNHVRRLLGHLGASSRLEAVVIAACKGMLELRPHDSE